MTPDELSHISAVTFFQAATIEGTSKIERCLSFNCKKGRVINVCKKKAFARASRQSDGPEKVEISRHEPFIAG